MPLIAAFLVLIAVSVYAAWEMFRVARFWQDSERGSLRVLALLFKILAIVMCLLALAVGAILMLNQP